MNTVKETLISDITLYNQSTTEQQRTMLGKAGFTTNVLFWLAYKIFNECGAKQPGQVPPMMDANLTTTSINTFQPLEHIIRTRFNEFSKASYNTMNFEMFRDNVQRAVFQMYYSSYNQFSLLYYGVLEKYKLRGVILDITNFQLISHDRVLYEVYDTMCC